MPLYCLTARRLRNVSHPFLTDFDKTTLLSILKKIGGSAGQTKKRIEKRQKLACFFEYSI